MNKKTDKEIGRAVQQAVFAIYKNLRPVVETAVMGAWRMKWTHREFLLCELLCPVFWMFVTARDHRYLDWFGGLLHPWILGKLLEIPWAYHWTALYLLYFLGLSVAKGIKPYKEKKDIQEALDGLEFKSGNRRPRVASILDKGDFKKVVTVSSFGVGPNRYKERKDDLQNSLSWIVNDIRRSKIPKCVDIFLTEKELAKRVDYDDVSSRITRPYGFVVGESFSGIVTAALPDLPHLLIAGVTGSGKSTFLNAVLIALLENSRRLQVFGIDLKEVELGPYAKFPNFTVDKTLGDALGTLKKVERIMEKRYTMLSKKGSREIDPERDGTDRILVVVDECADLYGSVNNASKDAKLTAACKDVTNVLARKGRAAGIHLILATQRVSAKTLDSRIVANIPAKVCFRMTNISNSSTVLGSKAAFELEETPGRALWSFGTTLEKIQAPYIDLEDVNRAAATAEYEHGEKLKAQSLREESKDNEFRV